jgi:hypothetical protein
MDFAEAIELSKKFPTCNPKIFKGFSEWGILDTETDGYVVFTNAASAKESCFNEVESYAKSHKLRIDQDKNYLMICTP